MGHLKTAIVVAALVVVAGSARADQLIRKAGEWRSTVTGIGPPQTMDMCYARTTMDQAMAKMAASGHCPKRDIRQNGSVMTLDVVCDRMSMKGTATMIGDSAYTADLTMTMNMPGRTSTFHSITTSKWIGACKPGETPRD